jgi:hypothetical protein
LVGGLGGKRIKDQGEGGLRGERDFNLKTFKQRYFRYISQHNSIENYQLLKKI